MYVPENMLRDVMSSEPERVQISGEDQSNGACKEVSNSADICMDLEEPPKETNLSNGTDVDMDVDETHMVSSKRRWEEVDKRAGPTLKKQVSCFSEVSLNFD